MAKQRGQEVLGNTSNPLLPKTRAHHTTVEKAKIVRSINEVFSNGSTIDSACEAHGITPKTFWVWRNQTEELKDDYKRANMERHEFRKEKLRESAFSALEHLLKPQLRVRIIKEGKQDENGNLKVTKEVHFQEFKDPNWQAVKATLEAYAPEDFKTEDGQTELIVTFTDDAKNHFGSPIEKDE